MKVPNGKYKGHLFYYLVTYSINDMQGQNHHHEEVLINDDLHNACEEAFNYYSSRVEWALDAETKVFNELTSQGYKSFKIGENFAFGPAIYFVNYVGPTEEYQELIVDGDIENTSEEVS